MTRITLIALSLLAVSAGTVEAQSRHPRSPITAALNAGTTGVGAEVQLSLGPVFVLRGGIDTLGYDFDEAYSDVDYSGRFDFDTVSGFVDLHPFLNGFLISGGVYVGDRVINLNARPNAPVDIGGATFTPARSRPHPSIWITSLSPEPASTTSAPWWSRRVYRIPSWA